MENQEILKRKIQLFFSRNEPIHVVLESGRWKNGRILEVGDDFFMLQDDMVEYGNALILFDEIKFLEKKIEK